MAATRTTPNPPIKGDGNDSGKGKDFWAVKAMADKEGKYLLDITRVLSSEDAMLLAEAA